MAMIDSAIWIVVHLFYCNIICFDYSFRDEMVQKGGDETEPQNRQLSLYCIAHSCFVLSLLDLKMYTKQINFASHVLLMRFIEFRFCQLALPQSNAPCVLIRIRNPAVPRFMRRAWPARSYTVEDAEMRRITLFDFLSSRAGVLKPAVIMNLLALTWYFF